MKKLVVLLVSVCIFYTSLLSAETGPFVYSSPDARLEGMGGPYAALGGGISSLSVNPAGLYIEDGMEFLFSHSADQLDIYNNYLSWGITISTGFTLAAGYHRMHTEIEEIITEDKRSDKTYSNNNVFLGASMGYPEGIMIGLTAKYINKRYSPFNIGGVSADLGMRVGLSDKYTLGYTVKNVVSSGLKGKSFYGGTASESLSRTFSGGVSRKSSFFINIVPESEREAEYFSEGDFRQEEDIEQLIDSFIEQGLDIEEEGVLALNILLSIPDLYDRLREEQAEEDEEEMKEEKGDIDRLVKKTEGLREMPFSELEREYQRKIIKLNMAVIRNRFPEKFREKEPDPEDRLELQLLAAVNSVLNFSEFEYSQYNAGIELMAENIIGVRGGWNSLSGISVGVTVWKFDYAYIPDSNTGYTHMVSFRIGI